MISRIQWYCQCWVKKAPIDHTSQHSHTKGCLVPLVHMAPKTSWPFGTAGCSCLWEVQELLWVQVSSFVSLRLHGPQDPFECNETNVQHQPWYIPKSERNGSPSGWTWCGTLRWYSMGTLRYPFHTLAPQSFYSTTPTPPPAVFHHSGPKESAMFLPNDNWTSKSGFGDWG